MRDAGLCEAEINCKTRAKEAAVRRAHKELKKKKAMSINQPVQEVITGFDVPVSPISEVESALSNNTFSLKKLRCQ
jgi:hypothetical protein